jgi:hypothetical protein
MKLLLDSGAYSAFTQGDHIDLQNYTDFIKRHQLSPYCYFNLDTIPGAAGVQELRLGHIERAAQQSYVNHQTMKQAGLWPIPVVHEGESFRHLEAYLRDGEPCIALAPFANGVNAIRWLDDCFTVLGDCKVKVHGLGLTTAIILHRYPWASVDSGTWFKQSAAALIPVPLYRNNKPDYSLPPDIISLGKTTRGLHVDTLDQYDLGRLQRYLAEVEIDLAPARVDYRTRWVVWIKYLQALAASTETTIYFVSALSHIMRDTLLGCGAEFHLLSYYYLRDQPDHRFRDYVGSTEH